MRELLISHRNTAALVWRAKQFLNRAVRMLGAYLRLLGVGGNFVDGMAVAVQL